MLSITRATAAAVATIAVLLIGAAGAVTVTADHSTTTFLETVDGSPDVPTPWRPDNWDVAVHSRNYQTFKQLTGMEADHQADCGDPFDDGTGTHYNNTYEGAVYQCKNHVMTSINEDGYGVIYLTPDNLVDFSDGPAVIRVDVSTLRSSTRDWIDFWITPWDDNMQLPFRVGGSTVDLQGWPARSIHVRQNLNENRFMADVITDYASVRLPLASRTTWDEVLLDDLSDPRGGPSAKNRQTIEIVISQTHLKVWMPAFNLVWIDTDIPALDWTQGVVQFGHHSYNPTKMKGKTAFEQEPGTWHWDNFTISPAVPFSMIHADTRRVGSGSDPFAHLRSQLFRRTALDPLEGRQHPRSRDDAPRDRVPHGPIDPCTEALDGRDAGHERDVGVLGGVKNQVLAGLLALVPRPVNAAVLVEV